MRVIDEKITDFFSTLNLGLEWIGDAGRKLVAMVDENPSAFDDILEAAPGPWLTLEVLRTIEAVGRGHISTELLLVPLYVLKRLAALPPDVQIQAAQGIDLARVPPNGKPGREGSHPSIYRKPACKLTKAEAHRAIGPNGIRTPAEQLANTRYVGGGTSMGKYQIVMQHGQEPKLERIPLSGGIPDYQKQRVKLINGCALIELYL